MSLWLETDEYEDVAHSLLLVLDQLPKADQEAWRWKWIVIALFSALQGASVCAATKTDGTGPYQSAPQSRLRQLLYERGTEPASKELVDLYDKRRLAAFKDLMKLVVPELNLGGEPDRSKTSTEQSVIRLWRLRNDFSHFQPTGWVIELSGMLTILGDTLYLIEEVIRNRHLHRMNHFQRTGTGELILKIRQIISGRPETE